MYSPEQNGAFCDCFVSFKPAKTFILKLKSSAFIRNTFVYRELKRAPQKLSFCFKCPDTGTVRILGNILYVLNSYCLFVRELKQQRRRRLQKRHSKSEFAPFQTLSRLFHLVYFVKCWQTFLELNSKGLNQSSGKEKKVVVLCSRPQQNVNSGTFTL